MAEREVSCQACVWFDRYEIKEILGENSRCICAAHDPRNCRPSSTPCILSPSDKPCCLPRERAASVQQDALVLEIAALGKREAALLVVCDGIGGLAEGEYASSYVTMQASADLSQEAQTPPHSPSPTDFCTACRIRRLASGYTDYRNGNVIPAGGEVEKITFSDVADVFWYLRVPFRFPFQTGSPVPLSSRGPRSDCPQHTAPAPPGSVLRRGSMPAVM